MMKAWLNNGLMSAVDVFFGALPQSQPGLKKLAETKVVSHRGEFNNHCVFENTLAAFDPLIEAGVWGLE